MFGRLDPEGEGGLGGHGFDFASIADAVLGIDTLWGGDVMCPSGPGASSPIRGFPMSLCPGLYGPAAARMRDTGGVSAKDVDREAVAQYLLQVDLPAAIAGVRSAGKRVGGLRGRYLTSLADSFQVMWDLAMELVGRGEAVPYERCVIASTGRPPEPSAPQEKRERLAELLSRAGRRELACLMPSMGGAASAWCDGLGARAGSRRHRPLRSTERVASFVVSACGTRHGAAFEHRVPAIREAWFSGSMNYVGRARNVDGSPQYEATYEINASLQIRFPSSSNW